MIDLEPVLQKIRTAVKRHMAATGAYARFTISTNESKRCTGASPYGCSDAADILYMLGDIPLDPQERAAAVKSLQDFQNPETGLFHDVQTPGLYFHHPYHASAMCVSALELYDARPKYAMTEFMRFKDYGEVEKLIDGLDWLNNSWGESHKGAGLYACMTITGMADCAWRDHFFRYLNAHVDPEYGMSRAGMIQTGKDRISHHLNGWFHFLFCYHHGNEPFPYPERLIDACLDLYTTRDADEKFGTCLGFQEVDWVFPLNRAVRQTGYRLKDVKAALRDFADKYVDFLNAHEYDQNFDDLHCLLGVLSCLSELYLALPGELKVEKPLKSVLDRRPFI